MQPHPTTQPLLLEEWRPVVGYETLYEVSSYGTVRHRVTGYHPKPHFIRKGYWSVHLWIGGNPRQKAVVIHKMVAEAFLGPRPEGHQVNHIDAVKTNNCYWNLEWVTPKENIAHSVKMGLQTGNDGEQNGSAKLTKEQVCMIRTSELTATEWAKILGVDNSQISRILKGKAWKHLL